MAKALVKKETQALASYEEEFAKQAEEYANQEAGTGGGKFFSIRGGTLALNGAPIPGNQMAVVIVDSLLVNAFYQGDYDPDSPQGPSCYAFGRDEKTMVPHEECGEKQSDGCTDCPNNQFGSASKGRGKACKNGRRIAVIPAGLINKQGVFERAKDESFASEEVIYLNLPPTSLQGFGAYVKQVAGALKRPPHGVITLVKVGKDSTNTYPKVTFEMEGPVPDELIPTVIARNKETKAIIEFPFPKAEAREEKPKKAVGKPAARRF